MYDAIVVGARCAGSPLAMLLARGGAKVLLLDRATFPSDIPHGHFVHRQGPGRLKRWGLLDEIVARTPAVSSVLTDFGDFPLIADNVEADGVAWGYGPRRTTLDRVLVDAAVSAGAELCQGFNVDDFLFDGDRVAGIRGRTETGAVVEERATITVGADGRNSGLARAVQAPVYNEAAVELAWYFSYWSGVHLPYLELYARVPEERILFAFPTENGCAAVFIGFPIEELAAFRADIEASFMRSLDLAPGLPERVRQGHREERFSGATNLPNFYRKPFGPGWALVGDAGMHKDPYLALGIHDALRDAEFLAGAIGEGLSGTRPMDDALSDYEVRRNEASEAEYQENLASARFTPFPPEVLALRQAVRSQPEEATRLMKARFGLIDPASFFNPENLQRIMAGAKPAAASP